MARKKKILATPEPIRPGDEDLGEIRNIVGFHIRLAQGAVYRHFTEAFTSLDLTQKQVSMLWLVGDHPQIAQSDLARRMRMDRATTMAVVNRLEARNLLERQPSPNDGRKHALYLTDDGNQVLSSAKALINQHEEWLKSRFSDAEVSTLIELLSRIHGWFPTD